MSNTSAWLFIVTGFFISARSMAQNQLRPNILIVIADDWSYGHAGIYGDKVVKTPHIDSVAKEGVLFLNAFCTASSCTPSRASLLTGRYPHQLDAGASLWGYLPKKYSNYTEILQQQGYYVGLTGKGWGPGNEEAGGYDYNPAGKRFKDFATFIAEKPDDSPFSFWYGSSDPHRPYEAGTGAASGMRADEVEVPGWLPDVSVVRNDILDYYFEIERFDRQLGEIIKVLRIAGQLENTLIVITSDNGMPFPRAKATMYDSGTKIPLIMSWKGRIKPGSQINEFVSLMDLAPTFLDLSGQEIPSEMTGTSLLPLLKKEKVKDRKMAFVERERHANVRIGDLGYPARGIRTAEYLYIQNYESDRWPAGDPELYHSVGRYGDCDESPTKDYIIDNKDQSVITPFFNRAFAKHNPVELYDLKKDPNQLNNVASDRKYKQVIEKLKKQLYHWQVRTEDPRATDPQHVKFDQYPYFGPPVKGAPSVYKPD